MRWLQVLAALLLPGFCQSAGFRSIHGPSLRKVHKEKKGRPEGPEAVQLQLPGVQKSTGYNIFGALIASQRHTLPLQRSSEGWYSVNLTVGGVQARLAVDTGSEVLWVRNKLLPHRPNSSTWKYLQPPRFHIQYGRGAIRGDVAELPVLADHNRSRHTCLVGLATTEGGIWAKQHTIDGVFGLSCSEMALAGALDCILPSPEDSAYDGHQTGEEEGDTERIFSLQLRKDSGTLTVGPVPDEYKKSLVHMPRLSQCGHWTVPLLSFRVAGPSSQDLISGQTDAMLDSGTNSIVGPTFQVIALARQLGASPAPMGEAVGGQITFYRVPCASRITLPAVTVSLGTRGKEANVTLRGEDLIAPPVGDGADQLCRLQVAGWETRSWILGATFLTKIRAAIFDLGQQRVSIAL